MDKVKAYLEWLVARIEEPSTWAGSGLIAFSLNQLHLAPNTITAALALGSAFGGFLAVVLPEKAKADKK